MTKSSRIPGATFHVLTGSTLGLSLFMTNIGNPLLLPTLFTIQVLGIVLAALSIPIMTVFWQKCLWTSANRLSLDSRNKFARIEWLPALVLLLAAVGQMLVEPSLSYIVIAVLAYGTTAFMCLLLCMQRSEQRNFLASEKYVAALFLVSGFAALIYQVVWQRMLFTTFGVNSESVTIIVSVFMFGLGLGALFGGVLQKALSKHLLGVFLALEIAIGVFGVFSLDIIQWVGSTPSTSMATLSFKVYVILALPTLLMGATLPVLVTYLQRSMRNLGQTVSLLYAANTVGSAIAALITVYVLFVFAGQQTAVWIAALFNFSTAGMIYLRSLVAVETQDGEKTAPPKSPYSMPLFASALLLSMLGYIALSQEILWYRLLGYMTANKPQVFGTMLFAYLLGIAAGSFRASRVCEKQENQYHYLIKSLVLSAVLFYLATPLISTTSHILSKDAALLLAYVMVAGTAYLSGGLFPILVEMGSNNSTSSNSKISFLYFANIVGATTGPLMTGFVLLDKFSLEKNIELLTIGTIALALVVAMLLPTTKKAKSISIAALLAFAASVPQLHQSLYTNYLEELFYGPKHFRPFVHVLENRTAIIAVEKAKHDVMYGNGIYDGKFNTDPVVDSNLITRTYMLASIHPRPKRVLEIGMSTNSWSKVLTMYQPLEKLDIVEINKAYAGLFKFYPESNSVMHNPKVTVHYDDGRRWLKQHPEAKYDAIVMNTSFHWRSNATSLLSKEFLELCKKHLAPGGVIMYNSTGSEDAYYTATHVFKHVTAIDNFVAASDTAFDMPTRLRRENLLRFIGDDNVPVFARSLDHGKVLTELSTRPLKNMNELLRNRKDLWVITDDNMAVEYKKPKY